MKKETVNFAELVKQRMLDEKFKSTFVVAFRMLKEGSMSKSYIAGIVGLPVAMVKALDGIRIDMTGEDEYAGMAEVFRGILEDAKLESLYENVRRMLKEGNVSEKFIAKVTGLPLKEVRLLSPK